MRASNSRRRFVCLAVGAGAGLAGPAAGQPAPLCIEVVARKFEFTPDEIKVAVGRPVTLILRSLDFTHGFSLPEFELRGDCVPGKTIELRFTPNRPGRFGFVCDNFCGEGHDDMSGVLIVIGD